jgi:hypothetical protein
MISPTASQLILSTKILKTLIRFLKFLIFLYFLEQHYSVGSLTPQSVVKGGVWVLLAQLLLGLGAIQCHLGALALVEGTAWRHNDHVLGGNLGSLWLASRRLLVQDGLEKLGSHGAVAHWLAATGLGGGADAAAGCRHCTGGALQSHSVHTSLTSVWCCHWGWCLLASHTLVLTHLTGTLGQDGLEHLGSLGAVAHTTWLGGSLGCCCASWADRLWHLWQVSLGEPHQGTICCLAEACNWVALLAAILLESIEATAGTHADNALLTIKEVG